MIDGKVTIKDIAREAGVSPALVSFALNNVETVAGEMRYKVNEETAKRIVEVAKKHNYIPNNAARSLRSKQSRSIGVVLSDISNRFFADIARSIEDRAFMLDYSVMFGSTDEKAKKLQKIVETFIDKGVDGLIVVPCEGGDKIIREISAKGIPLVLLDRSIKADGISRVVLDNALAAEMAVNCLVEGCHRRIEMISYNMAVSNIAEREAGYRKAMTGCGLSEFAIVHKIDYNDIDACVEQTIGKINFGRVDAIVFATNSLAIAGIRAMNKLGVKTPEDVGVVAFDGSDAFDLYHSSITYIKQPVEQFASDALNLVIGHIRNKQSAPSAVILHPELVAGDSTKRK